MWFISVFRFISPFLLTGQVAQSSKPLSLSMIVRLPFLMHSTALEYIFILPFVSPPNKHSNNFIIPDRCQYRMGSRSVLSLEVLSDWRRGMLGALNNESGNSNVFLAENTRHIFIIRRFAQNSAPNDQCKAAHQPGNAVCLVCAGGLDGIESQEGPMAQ